MLIISLLLNLVLLGLLGRAARRATRLAAEVPQWSIAIFEGASPLALRELSPEAGPALTARDVRDVAADFVADPFLLRRADRWNMFFEILERRSRRGSIGLATSSDGRSWRYERVVLRERFHLSYPYVFEAQSETFMIPECSDTESVRLYRARSFPGDWVFETALLTGAPFVDASPFEHGGMWWMFTSVPTHDVLRLHMSRALTGPWREHPASPIVRHDPHVARPAGRVVALEDGRLLRFAQDDDPTYGRLVRAFAITSLSETSYTESPAAPEPILAGSGFGWNSYKMHHVDAQRLGPGRWIAAVDGKGFPFDRRAAGAPRTAEEHA